MDIQTYARKPFTVEAVQVTLENVGEVAKWAGGTVEQIDTRMLGTTTTLPGIVLPATKDKKPETAEIGHWVVMHKGTYRAYRPQAFTSVFQPAVEETSQEDPDITALSEDQIASKI